MTESQYLAYSSLRKDDSSSSSDSEGAAATLGDFSSSELSAPDDSEDSFDAGELLENLRKVEREQKSTVKQATVPKSGPIAQSDDDLRRMMELDPRALFASRATEEGSADGEDRRGVEEKGNLKKKKKKHTGKPPPRDPNFNTNVFSVRQILREAYRNLPYYDFVALINFVHRGLKSIKHSDVTQISYWHADDPILKHLTGELGENSYPEKLLTEMGFFLLDQKEGKRYWVWPYMHLQDIKRNVPRSANCTGTDRYRLDDMVKLVKMTQNCLNKQGKAFRGHILHSIGSKR